MTLWHKLAFSDFGGTGEWGYFYLTRSLVARQFEVVKDMPDSTGTWSGESVEFLTRCRADERFMGETATGFVPTPRDSVRAQLFSHVLLFATPCPVAHQASLSIGSPRQDRRQNRVGKKGSGTMVWGWITTGDYILRKWGFRKNLVPFWQLFRIINYFIIF